MITDTNNNSLRGYRNKTVHEVLNNELLGAIKILAETDKQLNSYSLIYDDYYDKKLPAIWISNQSFAPFNLEKLGTNFLSRQLVKDMLGIFIDNPDQLYRSIINEVLNSIEEIS